MPGGCDGAAMNGASIGQLLNETIGLARAGRWAEYRLRFGAMREALLDRLAAEEHPVRRHLDILAAASPEHDAEGCIAELEALVDLLEAQPDIGGERSASGAPALDLRGLQPPEPIVRILDTLAREPQRPLRVILPHEPVPLYKLLSERGYRCSGAPRPDGGFEVLIESA